MPVALRADDRVLTLPKYHAAQRRMDSVPARFHVEACGRRFGKSKRCLRKAVEPALGGKPTAWFGPTYKQILPIWEDAVRRLAPVTARKSEVDKVLHLVTGGRIDFWSLKSGEGGDASRGRKYARVIVDEAAHIPTLETAWSNVIRPTLTDYRGDAFFPSTPRGRNFYWHLFLRGNDPQQPEWVSWQLPSSDNPFLPPEEIEDARKELPERIFQQEYEAQFLEDQGGVFRGYLAVAVEEPQEPVPGHQYVFGVDWGKTNDFTVVSVFDVTARRQVHLDRTNRIDYAVQTERLRTLHGRYRPAAIVAELNSIGVPLVEQLQRMGLPVYGWTATNATKAAVIDAYALGIERGQFTLLADPVQAGEHLAFEATRLPGGGIRYAAPEPEHDDTVVAGALAVYAATNVGGATPTKLRIG